MRQKLVYSTAFWLSFFTIVTVGESSPQNAIVKTGSGTGTGRNGIVDIPLTSNSDKDPIVISQGSGIVQTGGSKKSDKSVNRPGVVVLNPTTVGSGSDSNNRGTISASPDAISNINVGNTDASRSGTSNIVPSATVNNRGSGYNSNIVPSINVSNSETSQNRNTLNAPVVSTNTAPNVQVQTNRGSSSESSDIANVNDTQFSDSDRRSSTVNVPTIIVTTNEETVSDSKGRSIKKSTKPLPVKDSDEDEPDSAEKRRKAKLAKKNKATKEAIEQRKKKKEAAKKAKEAKESSTSSSSEEKVKTEKDSVELLKESLNRYRSTSVNNAKDKPKKKGRKFEEIPEDPANSSPSTDKQLKKIQNTLDVLLEGQRIIIGMLEKYSKQ